MTNPDRVFTKKSGCDMVCMGEGEITLPALLDAIENKAHSKKCLV